MRRSTFHLVVSLVRAMGLGYLPTDELQQIAGAGEPPPEALDRCWTQLVESLEAQGTRESGLLSRIGEEAGMDVLPQEMGPVHSAELQAIMPALFCVNRRVVPVAIAESHVIVACDDPFDAELPVLLREVLRGPFQLRWTSPPRVSAWLSCLFGDASARVRGAGGLEEAAGAEWSVIGRGVNAFSGNPDGPINQLVHSLIGEAVNKRASDIHIEPMGQRVRVRLRVDGLLQESSSLQREIGPALLGRIKVLADLSIAEKRRPQDGRMRLVIQGRELDVRVATIKASHGESAVLRVLHRRSADVNLTRLGLSVDHEKQLRSLLSLPDGLILVTGPTGSGKTTTLYGALESLNEEGRKIITVEDPVEYQFPGINQVAVRPKIGMTFARALRAILRQAPNVVMIGEVRDRETAEIALNAAHTGHLVLTTLHTSDAVTAVTRLFHLGLRPTLLGSALRGVLAQRLVRRTCPRCQGLQTTASRWHEEPQAGKVRAGFISVGQSACSTCQDTGYRGRLPLVEMLTVNRELRLLIQSSAGRQELKKWCRVAGLRTLREDGLARVAEGLTTLSEVARVTSPDELLDHADAMAGGVLAAEGDPA